MTTTREKENKVLEVRQDSVMEAMEGACEETQRVLKALFGDQLDVPELPKVLQPIYILQDLTTQVLNQSLLVVTHRDLEDEQGRSLGWKFGSAVPKAEKLASKVLTPHNMENYLGWWISEVSPMKAIAKILSLFKTMG